MKNSKYDMTRRQILKAGFYTGASMLIPWQLNNKAYAAIAALGLSDPAVQPKFQEMAPNALHPSFKYSPINGTKRQYRVVADQGLQWTGLVNPDGIPVSTPVWGYGENGRTVTWPGRTFEVKKNRPITVKWENKLVDPATGGFLPHLLPVDTNLHWAYSLPGYESNTIENSGVPIVPHLHGGHTDSPFDGNPEYFFSPDYGVRGPRWVSKKYKYHNDQVAGNLWYHDHALGITRLNVYAGLAGFYFIRDKEDTGRRSNPLGLPAYPYEAAYAIQDRMFLDTGELFYPTFPGDPFYADFITGEGAVLPPDLFPEGGPTALSEFFGDHMVVNGKIWPKENVEPRNYRFRLLNGCDSRFLIVRFRQVSAGETDLTNAGAPLPFYVIGSDQGLASEAVMTDTLVFEPGSRYDVVFDFDQVQFGSRIIMENIGGDAPFGGGLPDLDDFFPERQTDRIMAFDVVRRYRKSRRDKFDPTAVNHWSGNGKSVDNVRRVALFEGKDEFGRLQPLLGALVGDAGFEEWKAIPWHMPTTETPALNSTEIWEIYNFTGDAHPVHLHLVNFEIRGRNEITFVSDDGVPGQVITQHDGSTGVAPVVTDVAVGNPVYLGPADGYIENAPKDMVTALPGQMTRIKATFDKPGRYVWHCHILSHEDHEMMRVLQVVEE